MISLVLSLQDDESLSESSQEVVDQSEEIMQNFMFERYNRDMRSPEKSFTLPRSPGVIENFSPSPTTCVTALSLLFTTELSLLFTTELSLLFTTELSLLYTVAYYIL